MAAFDAGAIEARMELDLDPFQRGLKRARTLGREFERKPIKARLELVDKSARERLAKFRTAARRPINSKVDLSTKVAQERITRFRTLATRKIEVRVDLDDKAARARLAGLRASGGTGALGLANRAVSGVAGTLSQALGGIPVIGNMVGAALTGVTGAASLAGQALTQLLGRFTSLGSVVPAVAGQIASIVLQLAGMAAVAGGVVIALNAILGAVVALGAALVALVASLAAAAAGAALLGAALLATLGPAVLLGIGLFTRFSAVMKTRQAHEQALKQAVLGQAQAERTRKDALEAYRQAYKRAAAEYVNATRAMTQSALDLKDAELARQRSRLGVDQAKLNRDRTRKELRDFLHEIGASGRELETLFKRFTDTAFHPGSARGLFEQVTGSGISGDKALELRQKILDVRDANLSYKESLQQVKRSEDNLASAQAKRADFLKRGVRAYAPYRNAVDQTNKAHTRYVRALHATNRAQAEYERQLKKLTPAEQGALGRIDRLVKGFTNLAKKFSDPVFRAANDAFDRLAGKGSVFEGVMTKIGEAVGGFVRSFGRFLAEPASIKAFEVMGDGAAYLTRQLGSRTFIDFLRIMRDLARATLPSLRRIAREIGDTFAGWAGKTRNISDLRHNVVIPLVRNFRTWAGLAKDVAWLVIALFRAAAPEGRSLAESLRKIVQHWTRWINANPEKVRRFFRDAISKTKEIARQIARVVVWLKDNLPAAAKAAQKAFKNVYTWAKRIYDVIRKINDLAHGKISIFGHKINLVGPADLFTVSPAGTAVIEGKKLLGGGGNDDAAAKRDAQRALRNLPKRPRSVLHGQVAAVGGGEMHYHFHAHGITNPDHWIAKTARKLAGHPHFAAGRRREVERRGEAN